MQEMTSDSAMQIIKSCTMRPDLSDDEIILYEEALHFMLETDYFCENAWLFNLGYFYDSIGKYDLSVRYYSRAIEQGDTVSFIGLADTYKHMREYKKAYEYYIQAGLRGFETRAHRGIEEIRKWI